MNYLEVINATEKEMSFRCPWNQGDHITLNPGDSCQVPENWADWCRRHGMFTTGDLQNMWEQSGLEAELLADEPIIEVELDESEPLPATAGVLFDSKGKP